MTPNEYAQRVLHQYRRLPGTYGRILRTDRHLALELYHRGGRRGIVEDAFVLAMARLRLRPEPDSLEPIRSLHYMKPLIQELLETPPPPGYLQYLRHKLDKVGIHLEV